MLIKKNKLYSLKENLVTDEKYYLDRRNIIKSLLGIYLYNNINSQLAMAKNIDKFNITTRPTTKYDILTKYNNYFEFGTTKEIWKSAQKLNTENWNISIKGGRYSGKKFSFESLKKKFDIEERIYKFRCVEAWSMIVPWNGFELFKLIKFLEPETDKKYISFKTFFDPQVAFNQKQKWYPWPYQEIITLEEAQNPLAFIATGVYGKSLPKQNGAPLRLVLPWKYGFKSIKSITQIEFLKERKKSFWQTIAPKEYGFWANVNPKFPHRRWSQEFEKDIGSGEKFPTKIFNGYEKWVKPMYKDLENRSLFF